MALYEPCITLQYVYNQQDAQFWGEILFYFQYTLHIFRTVSVHLQEQYFYKPYPHTKYDIQLIKRLLLKTDLSRCYVEQMSSAHGRVEKRQTILSVKYVHYLPGFMTQNVLQVVVIHT